MHPERIWFVLIGVFQGLFLLAAHEIIAGDVWSARHPLVVAWYAAVVGVPVALELMLPEAEHRRLWRASAALALVLLALGAYAGYAVGESGASFFTFGVTVGVAWFVALPFIAIWARTGRLHFPYDQLFTDAWRNTLTLGLAALFTGVFWALLALWAGLFKVIGVDFFATLFSKRQFIYPATGLAFGVAIHLGHTHAGAVTTIRKVTLAAYRGLLPLLAVMVLLFLAFLPFTGLQPLWDTGRAAALLLATQFVMILFVNAAYQDGTGEPPYSSLVRRIATAAIITLPVYSGLTLYALGLRVSQHGWTGTRVWAMLLAVIAALYAMGYMAAALERRQPWLRRVNRINVGMALFVIGILVAANTPLLDPMRIGAASQMTRLLDSDVPLEGFDYRYLRFDAGRYGIDALRRLSQQPGTGPEANAIREAAAHALRQEHRWAIAPQTGGADDQITLFPAGKQMDAALAAFMASEMPRHSCPASRRANCIMLAVDLNGDHEDEYVQFFYPFHVYARSQEGWRVAGRATGSNGWNVSGVLTSLQEGAYGIVPPTWPVLKVGSDNWVVVEETE